MCLFFYLSVYHFLVLKMMLYFVLLQAFIVKVNKHTVNGREMKRVRMVQHVLTCVLAMIVCVLQALLVGFSLPLCELYCSEDVTLMSEHCCFKILILILSCFFCWEVSSLR